MVAVACTSCSGHGGHPKAQASPTINQTTVFPSAGNGAPSSPLGTPTPPAGDTPVGPDHLTYVAGRWQPGIQTDTRPISNNLTQTSVEPFLVETSHDYGVTFTTSASNSHDDYSISAQTPNKDDDSAPAIIAVSVVLDRSRRVTAVTCVVEGPQADQVTKLIHMCAGIAGPGTSTTQVNAWVSHEIDAVITQSKKTNRFYMTPHHRIGSVVMQLSGGCSISSACPSTGLSFGMSGTG
jgi:hypothetical protein